MTYKPGHHSYLRPPLLPSSPPPVPLDPALQVEDLARISFQNKPLYVGVDDARSVSTREGLEQGYCVVPADKRFLLLFTFLKKNMNKKVGWGGAGGQGRLYTPVQHNKKGGGGEAVLLCPVACICHTSSPVIAEPSSLF